MPRLTGCRRAGRFQRLAISVAFTAAAAAYPLVAQDTTRSGARLSLRLDSLRRALRLPPPPVRQVSATTFVGAPGSSFGSPTPFGAASGDYFVGAGYQSRTRFTRL